MTSVLRKSQVNKISLLQSYIDRGWPIFPLGRTKKPCIPSPHKKDGLQGECHGECGKDGHGFYDATLDFKKIKKWDKLYPNANWAMRTGSKETGGAGLVVIDIDKHNKNGFIAWEQLREEHSEPIETVTVLTKSGGNHLYFEYPSGAIKSGTDILGSGIDIKADGGYVCIPASGGYTFELSPDDTEVEKLPEWIFIKLGGKPARKKQQPKRLQTTNAVVDADLYADAIRAVSVLNPTRAAEYLNSLRVGMALHDGFNGAEVGKLVYDYFLQKSPEEYDDTFADEVWAKLDPRDPDNKITIKSLWYWARKDSGGAFFRHLKKPDHNFPIPIEDAPISIDLPKPTLKPVVMKVTYKKAVQTVEPVPANGILGVSIGVSRALLRAGLYHYARAYEILAEKGYLGKVISRKEFFSVLEKYMKNRAVRAAFAEFSGRQEQPNKGITKSAINRKRSAFFEFVSIICYINTIKNVEKQILDTNSFSAENSTFPDISTGGEVECHSHREELQPKLSKRGRAEGRPPTAQVYIPSTGEIEQILLKAGLRNRKDRDELSAYPVKPFEVLASQKKYKAFIMAFKVFENGLNDYSRKEIAATIGISLPTVKEYAELMDVSVTFNPPTKEPIKRERIKHLPVDEDEYDRRVAMRNIPEGCHITAGGNEKKYGYTQSQAYLALEESGGNIYKTCYVKSTYDPSFSQFNPYRNKSMPAFEVPKLTAQRRKENRVYRQEQKQSVAVFQEEWFALQEEGK